MNRRPADLNPGDVIALAAPARYCTPDQVASACAIIEHAGFTPYVPEGLTAQHYQFAGTDRHRAALLSSVLNEPAVKAVWCMRGGYGSARLLPFIEWPNPENMPWLLGFSDVTALHAAVNQLGVCSLHAPVATTFSQASERVAHQFFQVLRGQDEGFTLRADAATRPAQPVRGPLLGGNVSVLFSLQATPWFPDLSGAVLFIEEVDEMLYHLDRMLLNFELSGVLDRIVGLVVGGMTDMRDNTTAYGFSADNPYGYTPVEIIAQRLGSRRIPVVGNFQAGHIVDNTPLVLGAEVTIL